MQAVADAFDAALPAAVKRATVATEAPGPKKRGPKPTNKVRPGTVSARVVDLFRAGKSHAEIAAELGISVKHSGVTIVEQRRRGVPGLDRRPGGARKAVTP